MVVLCEAVTCLVGVSVAAPTSVPIAKFRQNFGMTKHVTCGRTVAAVTRRRTLLSPTRLAPVSWITHEQAARIVSPTFTPDTLVRARRVSPHFAARISSAAACSNASPFSAVWQVLAGVGEYLDTLQTRARGPHQPSVDGPPVISPGITYSPVSTPWLLRCNLVCTCAHRADPELVFAFAASLDQH